MNRPPKPIRVLIVDDSPFIRMALKEILAQDPDIEVVGVARDGKEGIAKLQELKPDVVTMDVEMPVMDGIRALDEIMRWQPTPVIVLSAVTTQGARATMEAFDLGAVEVIAKPTGRSGDDLASMAREIILKVKSVVGSNLASMKIKSWSPPRVSPVETVAKRRIEVVAIGVSTGGPTALQVVLGQLPRNFPVPIIVAQHMPAGFTAPLASRFDGLCDLKVKEVEEGETLRAGTVYIGEAGKQFEVRKTGAKLIAKISGTTPSTILYKPSVDILFKSLAQEVGQGVLALIMTGMGSDGLEGVKELKAKGAFTIAESEKTCVVYGMPRVVIEAGLADRVEELSNFSRVILEYVGRR